MKEPGTGGPDERAGIARRRATRALFAALIAAAAAGARGEAQEEPIADNSFLIEEAYNQEPGVVQHISTFLASGEGDGWATSFTQEWPAPNQRHQLSYTLAAAEVDLVEAPGGESTERGFGDVAINYRYQATGVGGGPVAFAPRLSLVLPTGDEEKGLGAGARGLQANLPLSAELGARCVGHWNLGGSWFGDAKAPSGAEADLSSVTLGQGLVWLVRPKLNLMLEASWTRAQVLDENGRREHEEVFLVSPGLRWAIDLPSGLQIVPGLAVPIGVGPSDGEWSVFLYLSFEHAFRR